ncbi:MAG: VIT1/CCC1 transporter family protein [Hyphomonas sp.]
MTRLKLHLERHAVSRTGWLRAAVLGANDGIISTASLIVGVAAANASGSSIVFTGLAGLVAGALSMAAGEYVSVSSQSDTEKADVARETKELQDHPEAELNELTGIYLARGLTPELAREVAGQLMAKDALAAHVRDELHITDMTTARPVQAALTSAATFAIGAALPLLAALLAPATHIALGVTASSLAFLAVLGAVGARAGDAPIGRAVIRVTFWGAVAMAITAGIGRLFGAVV